MDDNFLNKFVEWYAIKFLYQCQLDKCNELTKIKIEKMIKKLSYTKKDNYSIDDYLKIIELYDIYLKKL